MNLKDFTNTKKYKAALPTCIMLNFFLIIFGNYFIPYFSGVYLIVMFGYGTLRSFHNTGSIILGAWRGIRVLERIK